MALMKSRIFFLAASALLLAACGGSGASSSSSAGSSVSLATRPTLDVALARFDRAGRNTVTFNLIAADLNDSSAPISYVNPQIRIGYSERGYFAEPQEGTGWPASLAEGFGLISFKDNEIPGYEAGVYPVTGSLNDEEAATPTTSSSEAPTSDASSSSSSSEAPEVITKWNLTFGEKLAISDPYEGENPQYLSDHSEEVAAAFHKGISSEIETTEDQETMELIARCMSVDGVVKEVFPDFRYSQVDIFYGRSATTFTFSFYGYVDGDHADSAALGNGFCVAEAILLPNANLKIEAFDEFLAAYGPKDSSSSSEVNA